MTPEELTKRLHVVCGSNLIAVILHGSAAAGDHAGRRSDYNLLVILDRLGAEELTALSKPVRAWATRRQSLPLFVSREELTKSSDAFPLELADLIDRHHVLYGEDVIAKLSVSPAHLRVELEHELKGKLMQLRARSLLVRHRPRELTELMIRSLSTFLVLCRGALRLYQPHVPAKKLEALAALARHVPIQTEVFETISQLKAGRKLSGVSPERLFAAYLQAIEVVVEAVDGLPHRTSPQQEAAR